MRHTDQSDLVPTRRDSPLQINTDISDLTASDRDGDPESLVRINTRRNENNFFKRSMSFLIALIFFLRIFITILWKTVSIGLSYDFSLSLLCLGFFGLDQSSSEEETAAIPLITTILNSENLIYFAILFAIGIHISKKIGELNAVKGQINLIEEQNDADQQSIVERRVITEQIRAAENECLTIKNEIAAINKAGIVLALCLSVPFIATTLASPNILRLFKQDEDVIAYVKSYMQIYWLGFLGLGPRLTFEQIVVPFEGNLFSMCVGFIDTLAFTTLAAYWRKSDGLRGIAKSYTIGINVTGLAYLSYLLFWPEFKDYRFFRVSGDELALINKQIRVLLKTGFAILLNNICEVAMGLVATILAGRVGVLEQSALSYGLFGISGPLIFSAAGAQACTQLLSGMGGGLVRLPPAERNYGNVTRVAIYCLLSTAIINVPLLIVMAAYPEVLTRLFGVTDESTSSMVHKLVPFIAWGAVADVLRNLFNQTARAFNYEYWATALSFGGLFIGFIVSLLSLLLNQVKQENKIYGIALGFLLGYVIAAVSLGIFWLRIILPQNLKERFEKIGLTHEGDDRSDRPRDEHTRDASSEVGAAATGSVLIVEQLKPSFKQRAQPESEGQSIELQNISDSPGNRFTFFSFRDCLEGKSTSTPRSPSQLSLLQAGQPVDYATSTGLQAGSKTFGSREPLLTSVVAGTTFPNLTAGQGYAGKVIKKGKGHDTDYTPVDNNEVLAERNEAGEEAFLKMQRENQGRIVVHRV